MRKGQWHRPAHTVNPLQPSRGHKVAPLKTKQPSNGMPFSITERLVRAHPRPPIPCTYFLRLTTLPPPRRSSAQLLPPRLPQDLGRPQLKQQPSATASATPKPCIGKAGEGGRQPAASPQVRWGLLHRHALGHPRGQRNKKGVEFTNGLRLL